MTPLDQALKTLYDNPKEQANIHAFYELFLNSLFFVPAYDEETQSVAKEAGEDDLLPLVMQADGKNYMVMFDQEERAADWAEETVHCLSLPGYMIAEMSPDDLHWGLNVGTEYEKIFASEEIAWLKEVVRNSRPEGDA